MHLNLTTILLQILHKFSCDDKKQYENLQSSAIVISCRGCSCRRPRTQRSLHNCIALNRVPCITRDLSVPY